jgi:two-component system response regulator HydG
VTQNNDRPDSQTTARVLLVDDDEQGLESCRRILEFAGHRVVTAQDGQAALERLRAGSFDVILSDVRMPRMGGLEFLRALSVVGEATPVVLMTAFGKVEDAVWAMKLGAVDFLTKPFKRQALLEAVGSAYARSRAAGRRVSVSEAGPASGGVASGAPVSAALARLVGSSSAMRELRSQIERIAPTSATVLIQGESGTGKELVARAIHEASSRARPGREPGSRGPGRFVAINCAAVPEQLIESELFGNEKGAFTGASSARQGLFEAADGGTLLLDEIGDMPLVLQAKLLRVLQEGEIRRVGATQSRRVDVRVLAATHRDLREGVRQGTFRQDLLFRLEVIALGVPPLRERLEDLSELTAFFLEQAADRHSKDVVSVSPTALAVLREHSWPGNVRELANVIERAVVFCSGVSIEPSDLPVHLRVNAAEASKHLPAGDPGATSLATASGSSERTGERTGERTIEVRIGTPLREVEELLIRRTLEATSGDKGMTAKLLGINSRTIYRKLGESRVAADTASENHVKMSAAVLPRPPVAPTVSSDDCLTLPPEPGVVEAREPGEPEFAQ